MARPWVAFIGRTGTELREISKQLNRSPDLILTNSKHFEDFEVHRKYNAYMKHYNKDCRVIYCTKAAGLYETLDNVSSSLKWKNPFITLNGFMRILPEELCSKYEIYNGHPGDIITHPILKGKDPQLKAIELGLPSTCCVIHKVVEGVDEGKVLAYSNARSIPPGITEQQLSDQLREDSIDLWVRFLRWSMKL